MNTNIFIFILCVSTHFAQLCFDCEVHTANLSESINNERQRSNNQNTKTQTFGDSIFVVNCMDSSIPNFTDGILFELMYTSTCYLQIHRQIYSLIMSYLHLPNLAINLNSMEGILHIGIYS